MISSERVKKCPGETGHFPYSHKAFRCFLCFCCFLSKRRHLGRVYQMQDDRVFDHSHLNLRFDTYRFAWFDRYRNVQTVPQCRNCHMQVIGLWRQFDQNAGRVSNMSHTFSVQIDSCSRDRSGKMSHPVDLQESVVHRIYLMLCSAFFTGINEPGVLYVPAGRAFGPIDQSACIWRYWCHRSCRC